jgi:DNA-binding NtrC family response regulator
MQNSLLEFVSRPTLPPLPLSTTGNPPRILIVEDDVTLGSVLTRVIRSINPDTEIQWETTAEKALASSHFDLAIVDILLDGKLNGLDLWDLFKLTHPGMPLLFLSGVPYESFLRRLGATHADCEMIPPFLAKPLATPGARNGLKSLLQNLLEGRSS